MDLVIARSSRRLKYFSSDIFERKFSNKSKQKQSLVVERHEEYFIIVYSNIQENGNKM